MAWVSSPSLYFLETNTTQVMQTYYRPISTRYTRIEKLPIGSVRFRAIKIDISLGSELRSVLTAKNAYVDASVSVFFRF